MTTVTISGTFLTGAAAILALVYVGAGIWIANMNYRDGRPSKWRHNGPPTTWAWGARWVFWPALVLMPILWPVIIPALRWNSRWNTRKWNRMSPDQRGAEMGRFRAVQQAEARKDLERIADDLAGRR